MTDPHAATDGPQHPPFSVEELRAAASLSRTALDNLEKARALLPDYRDAFGEILGALNVVADRLRLIERSPAIRLSPARLVAEIVQAGETARAITQTQSEKAQVDILRAIRRLETIANQRPAAKPRCSIIIVGLGTALASMLIFNLWPAPIPQPHDNRAVAPQTTQGPRRGSDDRSTASTCVERGTDGR